MEAYSIVKRAFCVGHSGCNSEYTHMYVVGIDD